MKFKSKSSRSLVKVLAISMILSTAPLFAFADDSAVTEKTETASVSTEAKAEKSDATPATSSVSQPANPRHGSGFRAAEPSKTGPYKESDFALLYKTEKATLRNMPVIDKATGKALTKPIKFKVWNATLQRFEKEVTSSNGVLPDVELIKEHHYIIFAQDKEYNFKNNAYIIIKETGSVVYNDRTPITTSHPGQDEKITSFVLEKRATPITDATKANRVKIDLQLFYMEKVGRNYLPSDDSFDWEGTNSTLVLTSPFETIRVPIKDSTVEVELMEDDVYTVSVESEQLGMYTFPLTVKDHSERGADKLAYNHLSCTNKDTIMLFDKDGQIEKKYLDALTSVSGKTKVEGLNFNSRILPRWFEQYNDSVRYTMDEKLLDKAVAKGLKGDFDVIDIHSINMARTERSRLMLAEGQFFNYTTEVQSGKNVGKVSYIDSDGKLKPLSFTQTGNKIKFNMNSLSVYPIVVQYVSDSSVQYVATEGDGLSFEKGDDVDVKAVFKSTSSVDKSFENFSGVEVDNARLEDYDYTVTKGSTVIRLNKSFVDRLSAGRHTLTAYFDADTKSSSITFTIKPAAVHSNNSAVNNASSNSSAPRVSNSTARRSDVTYGKTAKVRAGRVVKTGDPGNYALYAVLLISSISSLSILLKRRKEN